MSGDTLIPATILAIEARDKAFGDGEIEQAQDIADDRAALLRHLDAIAAPADGEALGREAWRERATPGAWGTDAAEVAACMDESWEIQGHEEQERYRRIGLALYQRGHAAGALSREPEIAALREEAEKIRAVGRKMIDELTLMHDIGRRDGAREEREACIVALEDFRTRNQCTLGTSLGIGEAIDAIRARGDR